MFVCLFFRGSKTAEFGYCDEYDSCVLCAVSFISPLMAAQEPPFEVCPLDVTLIERLLLTIIITPSVKTHVCIQKSDFTDFHLLFIPAKGHRSATIVRTMKVPLV